MMEPKKTKTNKKVNNRRKSRELIMKSIYRGLVNKFDLKQIQKDIHDDPDFIRADEAFYNEILKGVFKNLETFYFNKKALWGLRTCFTKFTSSFFIMAKEI